MSRSITEILEAAGVEIGHRSKMVCPRCEQRKLTMSVPKGLAKCWGCGAFWTEHGDTKSPERDWATYIVATVAETAQTELHTSLAKRWLAGRGLPVNDDLWLEENDLGALPGDLPIRRIAAKARELFEEWQEAKNAEISKLKKSSNRKLAAERTAFIEVEIEAEAEYLENTLKLLPQLNSDDWLNSVVYIYRDASGNPTSLNIRDWTSEGEERKKRIMRLQPRPNRRGLFGVTDAVYAPGEAWEGKARAIVVEGEHNLLSLRATTRRWGLSSYLPAVAVGGMNGVDIVALERLLDGAEPTVIYDNDRVDPETGTPRGYALVKALQDRLYLHVTCTKPDKDLDDYITARPELTRKQFWTEVLSTTEYLPIRIGTIAERVKFHLSNRHLEKNERIRHVTLEIVADAVRRFTLINADGLPTLLYREPDGHSRLITVRATDALFMGYMRPYGIYDRDWLRSVSEAIHVRAKADDVPNTRLHSLAYWTGERLYINLYDGTMLRLSLNADRRSVSIVRLPVGDEGVFLVIPTDDSKYAPVEIDVEPLARSLNGSMQLKSSSLIDQAILSAINYQGDAAKYKQLIKAWTLAQFFREEMASMPALMFEGNGAAGKSTVGAAIGALLVGPSFRETNAPTTAREVAEKMAGVPLVVWDEFDIADKAVENAIKMLTTGGRDVRRQLFETSKTVELTCDAGIIATSNSNPIKQAGAARRFIVIPVAPRSKDGDAAVYLSRGAHLSPQLLKKRSTMWVELIADLARCMISLANTPRSTKTVFSMADFGVFVQRCANNEGWGDQAREMLLWVTRQQEGQQAETRVVLNLVEELLRREPDLIGQSMTAGQWTELIWKGIPESEAELKGRVNKNFFAYETKTFKDLFEKRLGMTVAQNRNTHTNHYRFQVPSVVTHETSDGDHILTGDEMRELVENC